MIRKGERAWTLKAAFAKHLTMDWEDGRYVPPKQCGLYCRGKSHGCDEKTLEPKAQFVCNHDNLFHFPPGCFELTQKGTTEFTFLKKYLHSKLIVMLKQLWKWFAT